MQTPQRDCFDSDVRARCSAVMRIDRIDRSSDDHYSGSLALDFCSAALTRRTPADLHTGLIPTSMGNVGGSMF